MTNLLRDLHALIPGLYHELQRPLSPSWSYLHVTYEYPHVERLYRPEGDGRLFLHRLAPVPDGKSSLWHAHPWPCATLIVSGSYEMDVGMGDDKSIVSSVYADRSSYEMLDSRIWHVVRPITFTWSIMLTGALYKDTCSAAPKPSNPGERLPLSHPRVQQYAANWALRCPRH